LIEKVIGKITAIEISVVGISAASCRDSASHVNSSARKVTVTVFSSTILRNRRVVSMGCTCRPKERARCSGGASDSNRE